jgi:pimeloyl-ACP methyl ester carboxylesterase
LQQEGASTSVPTVEHGRQRLRALGAALGDAGSILTKRIQETHESIAARSFAAVGPFGRPVRVVHDGIARVSYGAVRGGIRVAGRAAGAVAAVTPLAADPRLFGRRAGMVQGAICGIYGDHLERHHPLLTVPMTVRTSGRPVALESAALSDAFPQAGPRLAVFLHGLCETEDAWGRPAQDDDTPGTYGDKLRRQLGLSPLFVRYNSGLHVTDNAERLGALLEELVEAWPVEVKQLDLVGHSMGGLIIRGACDIGAARRMRWVPLVRHCVYLGTPHHGAPLERGVNILAATLRVVPETRVIASLLDVRSAGIKDLRFGYASQRESGVSMLATARHHAVAASLGDTADHPLSRVIGDLLVPRASAFGEGLGGAGLGLEQDDRRLIGRVNHFDLLDHPVVAELLHDWLAGAGTSESLRPPSGAAG